MEMNTIQLNIDVYERMLKELDAIKEVRAGYEFLLFLAMDLYNYYPNNSRKTAEEYFRKEIELNEKLSEHFSRRSF
jgi:hypothetical protein